MQAKTIPGDCAMRGRQENLEGSEDYLMGMTEQREKWGWVQVKPPNGKTILGTIIIF